MTVNGGQSHEVNTICHLDVAVVRRRLHRRRPTHHGNDSSGRFGTVKSDDGSLLDTTKFHSDGAHRKLTVHISASPDKQDTSESSPLDAEQLRQSYANGISETRLAVTCGTITAAHGFTVASDKQSALLNVAEIAEGLSLGQGEAEFYLEWDVMP